MKRKYLYLTTLFFLFLATATFAQDYEVRSIEHLPMDMTAKINNLTEKPNGGQPCAVLRIATQNILASDRDAFQFGSDMGSHIRERRKEGGEILLWVSPGINYLVIKHKDLGNMLVFIPTYLHGEVESLNTYRILIVGTKELPKEPKGFGSCQIIFKPTPEDAFIYLNGDSIGIGNRTVPTIAGTYQWRIEHPLYHPEIGSIELAKGETDTVDIALTPAYGYIKILDDYGLDEETRIFLNEKQVENMPFESKKLASGMYQMAIEKHDIIVATTEIEVKDNYFSNVNISEIINTIGNNTPNQDSIADVLNHVAHTRFLPITGKITIHSIPESSVNIDGIDFGHTPITIDNLAVGTHNLKLSSSGCTPLSQTISVKENEETVYRLQLPRACILTINSDEKGDHVYIDGNDVGKTPLTLELPFGTYSIVFLRTGKFEQEKTIHLGPENPELTLQFSFGKEVTLEADRNNSRVYVDSEYVGRTPIDVYLPYGVHTFKAEHGWRSGSKTISLEENQDLKNFQVNTSFEKPKDFLSNGAFFMTGNLAMTKAGPPVFGINIGDICNGSEFGWYFSFTANRKFIQQLINKDYSPFYFPILEANENGEINGCSNQPQYTGETSISRASALFGFALRVAGPVYFRIGAGAGIRQHDWEIEETHEWVTIDPYSWKGFECTVGLQCCIYNIVFNTDFLIPQDVLINSKKMFEFRVGLGYCLKHTKSKRK